MSSKSTRVKGQFSPFTLQGNGTLYGALFGLDSGVSVQTNKTGANLTFANLFGSASRPAIIGAQYNEWRVNSLVFEVQLNVSEFETGKIIVLAGNEDPNEAAQVDASTINSTTFLRILEQQKAVLIASDMTYRKSRFLFKFPVTAGWLFIQRNGESTAATNRQTSCGSLLAVANGAEVATYATLICHYDITLRGQQYNQSLSLSRFIGPMPKDENKKDDDEYETVSVKTIVKKKP